MRVAFLSRLASLVIDIVKTIARQILPRNMYLNLARNWHKLLGKSDCGTLSLRDWKDYLDDLRMDAILREMMLSYEKSHPETIASNYWKELNRKHVSQLLESGFENFKQTLALNYFTFLVGENHLQFKVLKENLSGNVVKWAKDKAKKSKQHSLLTAEQSMLYNFMTFMLWEYIKQQVDKDILGQLEEPLIGNPLVVELDGKRVSQDLANSLLDFQSISKGVEDFGNIQTVLELGAGYGRTAYVVLRLNPSVRYIIVDIPPALYVAQRYLSELFYNKKIFKFREFDKFSDVKDEFYKSEIIFLMPGQLRALPKKMADLSLAIDCLHEMKPEQIEYYFDIINKLSRRFFFTCFKKTPVPYENITLEEKDYPVRPEWKRVFWRTRKVQTNFFEAFFTL
jgi:putative sugar O-methyltransferase